jgi:hypothetical protein
MKCFILLSFLSLAVATASPAATASLVLRASRDMLEFHLAMQRGRRLDEFSYVKLTCSKNVTGVLAGVGCASDSLKKASVIFPKDSCVTSGDVSQKFSINGNQITHSIWKQNSCDDEPTTSYTTASEACYDDRIILKVYQGEGIELDSHGKKSDCSDAKPFAGGVKMVSGSCVKDDDASEKFTCSSDHKSITFKRYSDTACSMEDNSKEVKNGECFDFSPAAKTIPFWFRTVFVILAAVVSLH